MQNPLILLIKQGRLIFFTNWKLEDTARSLKMLLNNITEFCRLFIQLGLRFSQNSHTIPSVKMGCMPVSCGLMLLLILVSV